MIVVVEFSPTWGSSFEVTLDYDFGGGRLSDGSWSCLPGRLRFSDGYFEIDRWDSLRLLEFDDSVTYWDTVKYIFGADLDRAKTTGTLRDFGKWYEVANGQSGKGDVYLPSGSLAFGTWRIKSGAPNTLLEPVVKQP